MYVSISKKDTKDTFRQLSWGIFGACCSVVQCVLHCVLQDFAVCGGVSSEGLFCVSLFSFISVLFWLIWVSVNKKIWCTSDAHEFGGAGTEGSECELRLGAYGVPINKDTRIEFFKHNKTKRVLMWWVTFHTGYVYICICICVCKYSYMLVYIYTHTHTHIHVYVYT